MNDSPVLPPKPSAETKPSLSPASQQLRSKPEDYHWHEVWVPANVPNWFLVLVGIGGTVAAVKTLNAVSRQADVMSDANALTSKAIALQFRPKLVIRVEYVLPSLVADIGRRAVGEVRYEVANVGGSMAAIVDFRLAVEVLSPSQRIPFYLNTLGWVEPFKLEAGESRLLKYTLNPSANETLVRVNQVAAGTMMWPGDHPVLFAAVLKYKDKHGVVRATRAWREYDSHLGTFVRGDDPDREYAD